MKIGILLMVFHSLRDKARRIFDTPGFLVLSGKKNLIS